jgi:Ca2+-binding EF-hand superfamily protein
MRARTRFVFSLSIILLVGLVLLLETTPQGFAQKGGRFGGRPGGGFKFDPGVFFDRMSNGESFVLIAKMRDPAQAEEFAKKEGITNGKFTREQFAKYMEQRMQSWQKRGPGGRGGPGGGQPGRGGFDFSSRLFKQYDTNGDGSLNATEIQAMSSENQEFKDNWRKYDADKNGLINQDEFNGYLASRLRAAREQKDGGKKDDKKDADNKTAEKKDDKKDADKKPEERPSITRIEIDEVENNTVVVYRSGKLPKELPEWFTQLDLNNDGQVSLMEWLKANKAVSEFTKMDRNDDGLLTAEEVLYFNQRQNGGDSANGKTQTVSASAGPNGKGQPSFGGPPGFNGRQFGPGGRRAFQGKGRFPGGPPGGFGNGNFPRKGKKGMPPGE